MPPRTRRYPGLSWLPASERLGEHNPNAKMTNAEVKMMREYRAGGWSHDELAVLFPVSAARSSEICRGLAYKDAGGPIDTHRNYPAGRGRKPKKENSDGLPGIR